MKNVYQIKLPLQSVIRYYIVGRDVSCHDGDTSDCNKYSWLPVVNKDMKYQSQISIFLDLTFPKDICAEKRDYLSAEKQDLSCWNVRTNFCF